MLQRWCLVRCNVIVCDILVRWRRRHKLVYKHTEMNACAECNTVPRGTEGRGRLVMRGRLLRKLDLGINVPNVNQHHCKNLAIHTEHPTDNGRLLLT